MDANSNLKNKKSVNFFNQGIQHSAPRIRNQFSTYSYKVVNPVQSWMGANLATNSKKI